MNQATHEEIINAVTAVEMKVGALAHDVKAVQAEVAKTHDLVEALQAMKTGGKVITWLAKVMAGILSLWLLVKMGPAAFLALGEK